MRCFTFVSGRVREGISLFPADDGYPPSIHVGESGRGRKLSRVPEPQGATYAPDSIDGRPRMVACDGPGYAALVLLCDHSGFRGCCEFAVAGSHRIIADGYCADGLAGRMGGGPEYLVVLRPGASVDVRRSGRLYGQPAHYRVEWDGESLVVHDVESESAAAEAAAKLKEAQHETA